MSGDSGENADQMTNKTRIDVSWIRCRAEECLLTAEECDARANTFWVWLTRQRYWWRQKACWWRSHHALADEIETAAAKHPIER